MNIEALIQNRLVVPVPEIAEAFAVSRQYVALEVARGHLVRVGKGPQSRIDADSLRAWAARWIKDGAPGRATKRKKEVIALPTTSTATQPGQRGRVASSTPPNSENESTGAGTPAEERN